MIAPDHFAELLLIDQSRAQREALAQLERIFTMTDDTRTPGQIAYETELAACPVYHDGTPRKPWAELGAVERQSWERNPTPRQWAMDRGRAPAPAPDLYLLMSHDGWNSCMLLGLEPYSEAAARQSINWQMRGGARREQMKICRLDVERGAFVETGNGKRHYPTQPPYTAKAWAEFCARTGYPG